MTEMARSPYFVPWGQISKWDSVRQQHESQYTYIFELEPKRGAEGDRDDGEPA